MISKHAKLRLKLGQSFVFSLLMTAAPVMLHAAPLKVLSTLPDLKALAEAIGGAEVEADSLLSGSEDPHFVDATPDFSLKAAGAEMIALVGLDLEIGWLPKVLSKSGKRAIQAGGEGFCDIGSAIKVMDSTQGPVDRSMGDVHPRGNPHYWLAPTRLIEAASKMQNCLTQLRPDKARIFAANFATFKAKMDALQAELKTKLQAVLSKDFKVLQYHKEFSYFLEDYGIAAAGAIEAKPGVKPRAGELAEAAIRAKEQKVRLVIASEQHPKEILRKFEELAGVPTVSVSTSLKLDADPKTLEALQRALIEVLIKGAKGGT